jgi:cytochrome c-type biogenesis protein
VALEERQTHMSTDDVSVLLAFLAGIVSFLSPCVLPLVPAYIGHLAGTTISGARALPRHVILSRAALFVAGFSTVFIAFWVSVGLAFDALRDYAPQIRQVGGVVLIVMGLNLLGVFNLPFLYKERRLHVQPDRPPGASMSFLVGMLFAAGWTPCIGPVLGSIIGLASFSQTVWQGTWLLIAYCAGLGVPFLLTAAAFGTAVGALRRLRPAMPVISRIGAAFIVVVGVLMVTNTFARLAGLFTWGVL